MTPEDEEPVMVAAGGWCAPSMPLLEFEAEPKPLELPRVKADRNGIRFEPLEFP